MKFIKKYRKVQELKMICRDIIIKSLDEYTGGINNDLKKSLFNKLELTESEGSFTCLLESFSLFYKNGIFELSIPYINLFELIEKNIGIHYTIVDVSHNKYNRWMIVQFI